LKDVKCSATPKATSLVQAQHTGLLTTRRSLHRINARISLLQRFELHGECAVNASLNMQLSSQRADM